MSRKKSFTYKNSGVDIKAGEELVDSIKGMVRQTHSGAVLKDIGGFGGFFRADFGSMDDPVLISSVDGVGTKLIVAFMAGIYDSVGQDLVNHCVNDIAVCGAQPLFFLDYFSTGKLKQEVGYNVVKGFATACKENGVALIGGETAEMPDIYNPDEFDLAGTIVGVVDRNKIIDGSGIVKGDLLVGFKSNGLHTNGYSLARKVLFSSFNINDKLPYEDKTLAEELLRVHKSYLPVINSLKQDGLVKGFAHITGGGIPGNIKRILPEGRSASVDWESWTWPDIFSLIQERGNVPVNDMRATFNLGIGLIGVIDNKNLNELENRAEKDGEEIIKIGEVQ